MKGLRNNLRKMYKLFTHYTIVMSHQEIIKSFGFHGHTVQCMQIFNRSIRGFRLMAYISPEEKYLNKNFIKM